MFCDACVSFGRGERGAVHSYAACKLFVDVIFYLYSMMLNWITMENDLPLVPRTGPLKYSTCRLPLRLQEVLAQLVKKLQLKSRIMHLVRRVLAIFLDIGD